jgi:hypothetical protein
MAHDKRATLTYRLTPEEHQRLRVWGVHHGMNLQEMVWEGLDLLMVKSSEEGEKKEEGEKNYEKLGTNRLRSEYNLTRDQRPLVDLVVEILDTPDSRWADVLVQFLCSLALASVGSITQTGVVHDGPKTESGTGDLSAGAIADKARVVVERHHYFGGLLAAIDKRHSIGNQNVDSPGSEEGSAGKGSVR